MLKKKRIEELNEKLRKICYEESIRAAEFTNPVHSEEEVLSMAKDSHDASVNLIAIFMEKGLFYLLGPAIRNTSQTENYIIEHTKGYRNLELI